MANGKTAIVTGAGTGIGKAVAIALLKAGWNTVFTGRRLPLLDEAVAAAGKTDAKALAFAADVTQAGRGRPAVRWRRQGIRPRRPALQQCRPRLQGDADRRIAGRDLERRGCGQPDRLVPVRPRRVPRRCASRARRAAASSTTARSRRMRRGPGSVPYTATKHAITGLTKTLALDGRPFNIACGQIDIGNALTDMAAAMTVGVPQANGTIAAEATMDVAPCRELGALHGRPAARRQRAVHDDDGDEHAVRGAGVGRPSCPPLVGRVPEGGWGWPHGMDETDCVSTPTPLLRIDPPHKGEGIRRRLSTPILRFDAPAARRSQSLP